jgi:hypothetical protein
MAIRPKPQQPTPTAKIDERRIHELIEKGGTVAKQTEATEDYKRHQLRLQPSITERIDTLITKRMVKPSRHDWFLEAILEKLARDEGHG